MTMKKAHFKLLSKPAVEILADNEDSSTAVTKQFNATVELPKKSIDKGFTLLELMVTFAIVLIISLVAYPVLSQYFVQSKVTDAIQAATTIQSMVTNQIASLGSVTGSGASLNTPTSISKYVATYSVSNDGVISITTTSDAGAVSLTLTPAYNVTSEQVSWTCAVSNANANQYVPSECRI